MTDDELATAVIAAFTGDPDDLADMFADDGVFSEQPGEPPLRGTAEIIGFFMAYGGRREVAEVHDIFTAGTRGGLSYTVWFRSDAHNYGQHGRVLLTFDEPPVEGGQLTLWDGAWVELESGLQPWGGD